MARSLVTALGLLALLALGSFTPGAAGRPVFRTLAQDGTGTAGTTRTELDFQTEDVARAEFNSSDFLLAFEGTGNAQGSILGQQVGQRPALATLPGEGVSMTQVTLQACAMNQPHVHPRGTEFALVTEGESLLPGAVLAAPSSWFWS